ncbi:MAG: UDP-N-acetylmuramoyl-L-alanyl-D-glutamate--2,6-diaminopimelate ligase [Rhizobacter sp.]|nr:UDP-N-acetylmuramoyl-L-alanyl-D-glutamate--2,6-diaminopimelate ligase [Chlorobiales bacterium]
MLLKDLLTTLSVAETTEGEFDVRGGSASSINVEITSLNYDSRQVLAGSAFVAIRGYKSDGHDFIDNAVANGAVAVLCETFPVLIPEEGKCIYVKVSDTRIALAELSKAFYGNASDNLVIIGVTGTNGKTTTATLIQSILEAGGMKTGLIGTIAYHIGDEKIVASRTTPEALELHQLFARMLKQGCTAVVMEVSSHALFLKRTHGIRFAVAVFTNLTQDHLDFHGTMENYFAAKKILFDSLDQNATAITNTDDEYGLPIVTDTKAVVMTYAAEETMDSLTDPPPELHTVKSGADVLAKVFSYKLDGTTAIISHNGISMMHHFKLIGKFNVYNMLAAYCTGAALGINRVDIIRGLIKNDGVRGRMEQVWSKDNRCAIVDYAHTPDALLSVIRSIKQIKPSEGKLITVFGCGGDRDRTKRPEMGRIAEAESDIVILTSDNPRTEDPEKILDDIEAGMSRAEQFYRIADREQAIRKGITLLGRGDVVLVAGKGHETYQEVNGEKQRFDDREVIERIFHEQEGLI